jgi:thiol-disulfide isomerase/thioredoxin
MEENHRVRRRLVPVAAALALLASAGCRTSPGETKASCPTPTGVISVGESLPKDCSLERFEGGLLTIDSLRGKPAVINFWATWCTFCIEEMPAIQKVYAALGARVAIVGADLLNIQGETRAAAKEFGVRTKVKYPLAFDDDGVFFGYFGAPHRPVLPVTIFVRADGRVAYRQYGPLTEKKLTDLIRDKLRVS